MSTPNRILLLNDSETSLAWMSAIISDAPGFESITFNSSAPAFAWLRKNPVPALIITDLLMPDVDGWQFCDRMRSAEFRRFNRVPILAVSGALDYAAVAGNRELNANAFISVPCEPGIFLDLIRALVMETPFTGATNPPERAHASIYARAAEFSGIIERFTSGLSRDPSDELAIAAIKRQFASMLGLGRTGINIIDARHTLLYVDPEWTEGQGSASGRKCHECFMGRSSVCEDCKLEQAINTREMVVTEYVSALDGPRVVRAFLIPFQSSCGDWQVLQFNNAIPKTRQAEIKLQSDRNLLQTVINLMPDHILVKDASGRYLLANAAAARMMGVKRPEELNGRSDIDFFSDELTQQYRSDEKSVLQTGKPIMNKEELIFDLSDRKEKQILSIKVPMKDGNGRMGGVICIGRDITDRKLRDEQITQSQKLESLGVLASGIAHDFNNLLQSIIGNADLMMEDPASSPFQKECLKSISNSSYKMSDLTRQMVDYAGMGQFEIQSLNLNEIIRGMAHLLDVAIGRKARLHLSLQEPLAGIRADMDQLRQVILNLATNAEEALTDLSGVISISTAQVEVDRAFLNRCVVSEGLSEGEYIRLTISDSGCGMSREVIANIFDPFFTTKFLGRGMGLPAVLGIIRSCQGTMHVKSEPGNGSVVTVLFPIPPAEKAEVPLEESRGQAILIADDEQIIRDLLRRMLEHSDFDVLTATNSDEAVMCIKKHADDIALVLLDVNMPGDGVEATLGKMRELRPGLPVFLISGGAEEDARNICKSQEITGYIQKPIQMSDLLQQLRQALEKPKQS